MRHTLFGQFPLAEYHEVIVAEELKTIKLCITLRTMDCDGVEKSKCICDEI